jgi:hypothetical protein
MLAFAELRPGRMYGLSFAYISGGAVIRYEMRALMVGMDESTNMPVWKTRLASGEDQRLVIPREWMTRLELEKNKPPYLRRIHSGDEA